MQTDANGEAQLTKSRSVGERLLKKQLWPLLRLQQHLDQSGSSEAVASSG